MSLIHGRSSQLHQWHQQITELHNKVFNLTLPYEEILGCFQDPLWILYVDENKVVAMAAIEEYEKSCYVYNVAVEDTKRRGYIGTRMAELAMTLFAGKSLRGIVKHDNKVAQFFYEKLGATKEVSDDYIKYYMKV